MWLRKIRNLFLALCVCSGLIDLANAQVSPPSSPFIRVAQGEFRRGSTPLRFVGFNFWQAMNLGARGSTGNRALLIRELNRLQAMGVTNLRLLATSQGPDSEPWRITPTLFPRHDAALQEDIAEGLDFTLAALATRGMTAVLCLNNFWPWSGGFSQFLFWTGHGPIPYPPPEPYGDWGRYQRYTQQFYNDTRSQSLSREMIRAIVTRINTITGVRYSEDSTIFSWELANEPRGVSEVNAFHNWISSTARFIKSLDSHHLVTIGAEGDTPDPIGNGVRFQEEHAFREIDYATIHIWAENWGWYDPHRATQTYAQTLSRMRRYIESHAVRARTLQKPLVLEEFGLARDALLTGDQQYSPTATTRWRDLYFREVFSAAHDFHLAGINVWAWAGESRPQSHYWRTGDALIGDPPHERQGWYSIYDQDQSTIQIIREAASTP